MTFQNVRIQGLHRATVIHAAILAILFVLTISPVQAEYRSSRTKPTSPMR